MSPEKNRPIDITQLPVATNVCQQELREVWKAKGEVASMAHVIMEPGAVSLLHEHHKMTEVYVISEGEGILTVGEEQYLVRADMVMEIPVNTPHKLENTGSMPLRHLVIAIPAFDPEDVFVLEDQ